MGLKSLKDHRLSWWKNFSVFGKKHCMKIFCLLVFSHSLPLRPALSLKPDHVMLSLLLPVWWVLLFTTGLTQVVHLNVFTHRCSAVSEASVVACCFSPCGQFFVTGCTNGDLKLWDVDFSLLLAERDAHDLGVACCSSAPHLGLGEFWIFNG